MDSNSSQDTNFLGEALVAKIRADNEEAQLELYKLTQSICNITLFRRLRKEHLEDFTQTVYGIVFKAVMSGTLEHPERINGFIRQTAVNQSTKLYTRYRRDIKQNISIESAKHNDPCPRSPIAALLGRKDITVEDEHIMHILSTLNEKQQDILTRFYVQGQEPEQIQADMGLSETQYRNDKFRALQALRKAVTASDKRFALRLFVGKKSGFALGE